MLSLIKYGLNSTRNAVSECLLHADDLTYLKWYFQDSYRLQKFHNSHLGDSCFIIGNGPSLNKMDLSLLKGCKIFGLNKIYLIFDRIRLDLTYHVAVNPLVISQSAKQFQLLQCPSFLSMRAADRVIPRTDHIYRICTDAPLSFQPNASKVLCEGYTVTYVAMQLAFFMGFSTIYLIGVDHNFKAEGEPNRQQVMQEDDLNHFDPNYFKGQSWHLPDLEGSELAYRLAKFNFERNGRKIYDATIDGNLLVFPKITYQAALESCK